MQGGHAPIRIRGENSLRGTIYAREKDLSGCVSTFVVRALVSGVPSGADVLLITSEDAEELVIGETSEGMTFGSETVAVGTPTITLDIDPATIEAIPVGTYAYEWKITWPPDGDRQRKEPIAYGSFVREPTINRE